MADDDLLTTPTLPHPELTLTALLAVFLGGALGTLARYAVDVAYPTSSGHFPTATLLINLSGSLIIGLAVPLTAKLTPRYPLLPRFAVVGVLGGWTTYSALAVDAVVLGKQGHVGLGVSYLAATLVGGLALVAVGAMLAQRVVPE